MLAERIPHPAPVGALLEEDEIHLWSACLDPPEATVEDHVPTLSAEEQLRAARFVFPRDRRRFVVGRSVLRAMLGRYLGRDPRQIALAYGEQGKPRLADGGGDLLFNLAHAHELMVVALARGRELGVDLERIRPLDDVGGLAASVFAPEELATLRSLPPGSRQEAFFACWTRKEAFVKAGGEGIAHGLDRFEVSLRADEPAALRTVDGDSERAASWSLRELRPAPGYVGALAVESREIELLGRRWPDGRPW